MTTITHTEAQGPASPALEGLPVTRPEAQA
jgi:hypothetical protein